MNSDPNKKVPRTFQCRESLWQKFEQMARELECSVDYLINDAMKQYARQRGYSSTAQPVAAGQAPLPPPTAGAAPPPPPPPPPGAQPRQDWGSQAGMGSVPSPRPGAGMTPPPPPPPAPPGRASGPPPPPPPMPQARGQYPTGSGLGAPPPPPQSRRAPPPPPPPPPGGMHASPIGGMPSAPPSPGRSFPPPPPPPPPVGARPAPPPPPMPRSAPPAAPQPMHGGYASGLNVYYNGERFQITKDRFIIGRGKQSSDLTIKDPNVSRQHAMIEFLNGQYYIVDMGSTNGVEYNGQRVQRKVINEGDIFRVCDHELRFSYH